MLPHLGIPELLVILFIIILIFGANRLPDIGRGIGKGIRNFKDATGHDLPRGEDRGSDAYKAWLRWSEDRLGRSRDYSTMTFLFRGVSSQ